MLSAQKIYPENTDFLAKRLCKFGTFKKKKYYQIYSTNGKLNVMPAFDFGLEKFSFL